MIRSRRHDAAEQWLSDGLDVLRRAAFSQSIRVDMSHARDYIARMRRHGEHITYTHVFVWAAAQVLRNEPELHKLSCGRRWHFPDSVDIGLSIAGETFVAPVLVIREADSKSLPAIAVEVGAGAPQMRRKDREFLRLLRRWGWLVPFGRIRRSILSALLQSAAFRRQGVGTFQVSVVPKVDQASTSLFSTGAMLIAGRVQDAVVAEHGRPVVRPIVHLTVCADHAVWDGLAGERFLLGVKDQLESADHWQQAQPSDAAAAVSI